MLKQTIKKIVSKSKRCLQRITTFFSWEIIIKTRVVHKKRGKRIDPTGSYLVKTKLQYIK
jgi:hypothetical protein